MALYHEEVLADSPLLYLRFLETSGAPCANAGSLGGDATAAGTYTRNVTDGPVGVRPGITLGGTTSDFVSYPDTASLDITGDVTYECWVKVPNLTGTGSPTGYHTFMSKGRTGTGGGSSDAGYVLRVNPSRQLEIVRSHVGALGAFTSGTIPNDGAWHHVAFTRSGNTYTGYVDGASVGTFTSSTALQATTQAFMVGGDVAAGTVAVPLVGSIDEAAVYNTALSAARIAAHYDARANLPVLAAAFSGTPTSGPAPLTVQFTDESTGTPTSWAWDFGDTNTSTDQHPEHEYTAPGTYDVELEVTNAGGSDDEVKAGYITVTEAPVDEGVQGVAIAFDNDPLDDDPDWTRIDQTAGCRVSRWEVRQGRQDELEQTGGGEATIFVQDTLGLFDPTNGSSPYAGKLDSKQAAIAVFNPVTETWHTRFRGWVDDYGHDIHPSQAKDEVAIRLVDVFDLLAGAEMAPGNAGYTSGHDDVFFDDHDQVDLRLSAVLGFYAQTVGVGTYPTGRYVFFTGNVKVQEAVYEPGTPFLTAMLDAADAEWPGVANLYVDRHGRLVFHGRLARFNPEATAAGASVGAWDFTRWKAGDGAAVLADDETAQIRGLGYDRARKMIINAALATPKDDNPNSDARIPGQAVSDAASQDKHGVRSWSALELLTGHGNLTGNDPWEETRLFGAYYVENYKQPRARPRNITFRSLRPDDHRAAATWALMTRCDISDVVMLKTTHPGGGGFDAGFYIEGLTVTGRPLGGDLTDLTVTLDVSPEAYWTEDVFS
jgi:PKD repeat protein